MPIELRCLRAYSSLVALPEGSLSLMSLIVLYTLGVLLNTDFVPTKNFPSAGSVPQNKAGAPSH